MSDDKRYKELRDFYPNDKVRRRLKPHERYLGTKLATTHEGHWLMQQGSGNWTRFKKDSPALKAMVQTYGGLSTKHNLSDDGIKQFMGKDNLAPVVRGCMPVASSTAPAIQFNGDTWINSFDPTTIAVADAAAVDLPELQDILVKTFRMLRENLCGRSNRLDNVVEILAAAESDEESELEWRYLMSWLAKALQDIGCNMQTNAWLLGNINGLGRGTLTSVIMPLLWGRSNVTELQLDDVRRGGWIDGIVGKLIVVVNELTDDGKFDWGSCIKSYSCEPVVRIRHRGIDSYDSLNHANWIFTSNAEQPRCLDSKDRRNALIQCCATMDETVRVAACNLALDVYKWVKASDEALVKRYAGAMMHIFRSHKVDERLIEFAPNTLLKADVTDATAQDLPGLYWLQNDDSYPRDEVWPAHHYMQFHNRFVGPNDAVDGRGMGGILAALSRRGLIKRIKKYATKAAYWQISSELFPRESDVDAETRQKAKEKVVSIAMLPSPRRR